MPECAVSGDNIYYRSCGKNFSENFPVLFIHGAGGSAHVWSKQLEVDIPGYCPIALDLPGHARSQACGEEHIQAYVNWIIGFIQAMGLNQCVLAGHSMGGAITQLAALQWPRLFPGIVLVGTGARLRVAEEVLTRAWQGDSFADYAYAPNSDKYLQQEAEKEFGLTSPEVRYRDFLACDRFDLMHRVQQIEPRTLILCGQEDKLTPVKYSRFLKENILDSRLEIIPDAGHMVMWEQSKEFNRILEEFLT